MRYAKAFKMLDSIQLGEYSMSSGIDGVLYITATGMATSTFVTSTGTATGGTGTSIGSTTTGMTTTRRWLTQLFLFLTPLCRG